MQSIIVVLQILLHANAQVVRFGSCPSVKALSDFDPGNFSGEWFDVMSYKLIYMKGKCFSFAVKVVDDKHIEMSFNQDVNEKTSSDSRPGKIESPGVWSFKFDTDISEFAVFNELT